MVVLAGTNGPFSGTPDRVRGTSGREHAARNRLRGAATQIALRTGVYVTRSATNKEQLGTALNGLEAIAQAHALLPGVVLMDVSMPEMDGIEANG